MDEPIVAVEGLVKRYGEVLAVDDISFEIREAEIFGLLGPNGAGKTTTINALCTYTEPTAGEIFVTDHSVSDEPEAVKRAIGVVPQDIALYPDLNAVENLRFFGRMYDVPKARLEQRMGELLELVDLARKAPSGGNKQPLRYVISCAAEINSRIFETLGWAVSLTDWPGPEEGERPTGYIVIVTQSSNKDTARTDLGIAAQTILLGATARGLGGVMMGTVRRQELKQILGVEEDLEIFRSR